MRKASFQFFLRRPWPSGVRKDIFWSSSTATGALEREKVISEGNLAFGAEKSHAWVLWKGSTEFWLDKNLDGPDGRGTSRLGSDKPFWGLVGEEQLVWGENGPTVGFPTGSCPPPYSQFSSTLWPGVVLHPMDGSS